MQQIFYLFYVVLFMLISSIGGVAQNLSVDTLQARLSRTADPVQRGIYLMDLADAHQQIDLQKMKGFLNQVSQIPAYVNHPDKKAKLPYMYGALAERENKFDSATMIFEKILRSQAPITDSVIVANCHYKLGNIGRRQGKTDEAITHLLRCKALRLAMQQPVRAASADIVLGIIYKNTGLLEEAIQYYQAAYDVYAPEGMKDNMATCLLNIANVLTRQSKYDEALVKYEEALTLSEGEDHQDNLKAFVFGNMSNLYAQMQKPTEALQYAEQSYELRKNNAAPEEKINSLIGIAQNQHQLDRSRAALTTLEEASSILEGTDGLLETRARIYEQQYFILRDGTDPKSALSALENFKIFEDSLRDLEIEKQALELNTKYETERKESEIALLNADKALQDNQLAAQRRQLLGLLLGLSVLLALLFITLRLFRKTKSQKGIIQKALDEKDILLREIHHRVKNNLQFISSLLGLQTEHVQDPLALGALREGQDRVQSMALIHQNLYQEDNLKGVEIKDYFIKLIRGLFESYNIRKDQIELNLDIENLNLDVDSVVPIGLIVNELVSNSLKYAFSDQSSGVISVSLKAGPDGLKLGVQDNGKGMTIEERASMGDSFGYRLINVFCDQMDATLEVDGSNGTSVIMVIKKYKLASEMN